MHKFLRAVGFSNIKSKQELEEIFQEVLHSPTAQKKATDSEGNEMIEIEKEFGDFFGITLRGIYRENHVFELEYYFPHFYGKTISTREMVDVEKHAEKESYAGVCDEIRIGVTLIFYLQNVTDYLVIGRKRKLNYADGVILGALSVEGKILLPINKTEKQVHHATQENNDRNHLIAAAREGDENAIENLTLEDMDTYSLLSRRITHEDILSIVDSYFMPYGIESDQYSILGEIMDYTLQQNKLTNEMIYSFDIVCNDICFSLCINQKDLMGEPEVGRRFKGNIWMQGKINYNSGSSQSLC